MKKILLFILALALLQNVSTAQQAPDFTLTDCNGVSHHLYGDLAAGKAVIINFCAGWCGPCRNADPKLESIYQQYCQGTGNVKVYGMLFEDYQGQLTDCTFGQQYAADFGLTFPLFTNIGTWGSSPSGLTGDYVNALGLALIPTFYIIIPNTSDPANSVVHTVVGDSPSLESNILNVLSENGFGPSISISGNLCSGPPYSATLSSNFASGNTWSTGATAQSITIHNTGTYTLTRNVGGCNVTASKYIEFYPTPPVAGTAGVSSNAVCQNGQVTLNYTPGSASDETWIYRFPPDNTWYDLAPATYGPVDVQIPQSPGTVVILAVRATNGSANEASCITYSNEVQVTVNNCIGGVIQWVNNSASGVQNTTVKLTGDQTQTANTPADGAYLFKVGTGSNFTITPTKNINKTNGLSSADATAIQQHVTNTNPLPGPFKRIAADVNKSNSINALDASLITQALLGNQAALNQITSWRFVPASHNFPNPNVPWGFPEKITISDLYGTLNDQNFTGIKLGDVVATWANPANFGAGQPLVFRVQDRVLQAGAELAVEFRADQLDDLNSLQLALYFDPEQVQLAGIEPLDGLPVSADNFGTYNAAEGEIRLVWAQEKSMSLSESAPIFRLRFKALQSGARLSEVLRLNNEALPAHAYNSAYAESGVELRYSVSTGTEPGALEAGLSLDNRPNPFAGVTTLRFLLPEAGEAKLRISDAAGRLLFSQKKQYAAGRHEETLRLDGAAGVLLAELVTDQGSVVRRLLALR